MEMDLEETDNWEVAIPV